MSTKSSNRKTFNIASFSDVHLLHKKTSTEHVIANLDAEFPDDAEFAALDLITIVGDLFDTLVQFSNINIGIVEIWMARFMRQCAKHNVKLRVLEGTPYHEWKQSRAFLAVKESAGIDVDLVYHEKLAIEYIADLDIWTLWVPDEWRPNTDDTWAEVVALLKVNGIDMVDYVFLHGAFPYQLPPQAHHTCHNAERYLSITRKYILTGHIHQHSVYMDRIIAHGSFDRLTHGDEGAKGHIRITDYRGDPSGDTIRFIENTGAKIYKTLDVRGFTVAEIFKTIEALPEYPVDSHFRLLIEKVDVDVSRALTEIIRKYSNHNWDIKKDKSPGRGAGELRKLQLTRFTPQTATRDNILDILKPRIHARANTQAAGDRALELLARIIDNGSHR